MQYVPGSRSARVAPWADECSEGLGRTRNAPIEKHSDRAVPRDAAVAFVSIDCTEGAWTGPSPHHPSARSGTNPRCPAAMPFDPAVLGECAGPQECKRGRLACSAAANMSRVPIRPTRLRAQLLQFEAVRESGQYGIPAPYPPISEAPSQMEGRRRCAPPPRRSHRPCERRGDIEDSFHRL